MYTRLQKKHPSGCKGIKRLIIRLVCHLLEIPWPAQYFVAKSITGNGESAEGAYQLTRLFKQRLSGSSELHHPL